MSTKDDLKQIYKDGTMLTRIIMILSAVYLVVALANVFYKLFTGNETSLSTDWLAMPSDGYALLHRPWTLLTYMFLHENFVHFLVNILTLYWFGKLFMNFFGQRQLVNLYLMGGLMGGAIFILATHTLPFFTHSTQIYVLEGASAAIMAIVVAAAIWQPNYPIRMLFFGDVKLKWLALIAITISLLNMAGSNAGGEISHLGGALAGALYAYLLKTRNKDICAGIGYLIDKITNLFHRQPKWKVVYNRNAPSQKKEDNIDWQYNQNKKSQEKEIDRLLDKIKQGGYDSLNDDERRKFFEGKKK